MAKKESLKPGAESIWVFNGEDAIFPCAVFRTRSKAEREIKRWRLSGVLTEYPMGRIVYQWAVEQGTFRAKEQHDAKFVQGVTTAPGLDHRHYSNGKPA